MIFFTMISTVRIFFAPGHDADISGSVRYELVTLHERRFYPFNFPTAHLGKMYRLVLHPKVRALVNGPYRRKTLLDEDFALLCDRRRKRLNN
jgi:hypothetical protein